MSDVPVVNDYAYGFHDDAEIIFSTGKGLSEEVIRTISKEKGEPEWMLDYRLRSLKVFRDSKLPDWGPDLSALDFDDIIYYQKAMDRPARSWDDVPDEIKETFERIGIPQAEREYLAGAAVQYESEAVYHNMKAEFEKLGIVFTDTDSGLREYPELFKEHFGTVVPPTDNFEAALNSAAWSGGTFIYVPKGVKCDIPLQTYFRINNEGTGQFERTLIIVDEGASIHYVEGCTAPTYSTASLHAAIVEIIVKKDAIAFAGKNQKQDTGAKMIHNAPNTSSSIVSKSIAKDGGEVNYRGQVTFAKNSKRSISHIECDTIIMDQASKSDTIPFNEIHNGQVSLEHEAKVSKISEEQLFYLMSRGLSESEATEMIIMGFVEPFTKELPMEYAVELNRLISYEMEGSVG